jgi:hypothetical protein
LDIGANAGDRVTAITDGRVVFADEAGTLGNTIQIKHDDDDRYSLYAHLSSISVNVNDRVRRGQMIGRAGDTGFVIGSHLHVEIKPNASLALGRPTLNPCSYLDCRGQCDAAPGELDFGNIPIEYYYYHDTEENKFIKRPFELPVSVVDYLSILDCRENNNKRYNWETQNDMLCAYDSIWSCQRNILGLDADNKLDNHEFAGNEEIWQCVSSQQITPRFCLKGFDTITDEECCKLWLPAENGVLCQQQGFCTGDDVRSGTITPIANPPSLEFTGEGCMAEDVNRRLSPDQYCNNELVSRGLTPASSCCSWDCQNGNWVCISTNNALCQSSGVCSATSSCRWQCGNGVQPTGTCGAPPPSQCQAPNSCIQAAACPLNRIRSGDCGDPNVFCCAPA